MNYQVKALKIGVIFVGILLIYGAIDQVRKGETYGATGRGRFRKEAKPTYFWYLFFVRILLGPILILIGLFT